MKSSQEQIIKSSIETEVHISNLILTKTIFNLNAMHSGPRGTSLTKIFLSIFFIFHWDKFSQYCLVSPNLHFKMGEAVFCLYLKM